MPDVVRTTPCEACPYRRDVPSGVWSHAEYEKLRPYDQPTFGQPAAGFACHAAPAAFCHGWAVVHNSRGRANELLALRLHPCEVPKPTVPLFASGNAAADHGQKDIDNPSLKAQLTCQRLVKKHRRLREEADKHKRRRR